MTPDQALEALKQGNQKYADDQGAHPRTDAARRQATAQEGQRPLATVLGCSDSRVPIELIFHQGVGDVFVVRTAGHALGDSALASIEYAVDHLGTPLVLVLGHHRCGAVTAAVEGGEAHGHLPAIFKRIAPAVEQARAEDPGAGNAELVERAILANVRLTLRSMLERSPLLKKAAGAGRCRIMGGMYDLATGRVTFLT